MKRRDFWEAARIVAAAAALILLAFGLALGLGDEIAFPERQRVMVLRDGVHPPAPANPATSAAAVAEGGMHDPAGAGRGQGRAQAD